MKKLRIKDSDGEEFIVEELPEDDACHDEDETETETTVEVSFTPEEITEIKALLPQLRELLASKTTDEEVVTNTEEETSVEPDEDETITDSAASSKKKKPVNDAVNNNVDVNAAWQKIYNDALRGGDK